MKLVDILARELKVWPEGNDFVWQDYDLEIRFSHTTRNDIYVSILADDHVRSRHGDDPDYGVTRAEWQAAVDALNAPKVKPARSFGEFTFVGLSEIGLVYRQHKQPEWSEDGLPNVGTKCVIYKGSYGLLGGQEDFIGPVVTVTARFKSARGVEMACVDSGTALGCHIFRADMCFHLPTAEEIAFREREDAIEEMMAVAGMGSRKACTALYDRNYRKQVTK